MNIPPAPFSRLQLQMQASLINPALSVGSGDSFTNLLSLLFSDNAQAADPLSLLTLSSRMDPSSTKGSSHAGRNMALPDPESAYRMMSLINYDDVLYKAQFSELSQMKSGVSQMQDAGRSLGRIALSSGNDSIKSQLQDFVGKYNDWVRRFDPDIRQGGLLADTQAAQASRFELEQNINNRLFGAEDGVHGLGDLGITIDPVTRQASLDTTKLDALLASNKEGVVDTVQEFSANFAKSADLLNSNGNFILKQLDNLNRAIHFIADNKTALQAEFGTGSAARPTGQVAQALAAYNREHAA